MKWICLKYVCSKASERYQSNAHHYLMYFKIKHRSITIGCWSFHQNVLSLSTDRRVSQHVKTKVSPHLVGGGDVYTQQAGILKIENQIVLARFKTCFNTKSWQRGVNVVMVQASEQICVTMLIHLLLTLHRLVYFLRPTNQSDWIRQQL